MIIADRNAAELFGRRTVQRDRAVFAGNEAEKSLIEWAVQRDRAAFTSLYDKYVDRVYRHIYYRVSNQADAEDITQEVFIKAWKAIDKYKWTGACFGAWLMKVARNLIVEHYRARKKLVPLEETRLTDPSTETNPEKMAEVDFDCARVRMAVLKLDGEKQKVVHLHLFEGRSYKEISKMLNKSEGAIRIIQYRALVDLRHILTRAT